MTTILSSITTAEWLLRAQQFPLRIEWVSFFARKNARLHQGKRRLRKTHLTSIFVQAFNSPSNAQRSS